MCVWVLTNQLHASYLVQWRHSFKVYATELRSDVSHASPITGNMPCVKSRFLLVVNGSVRPYHAKSVQVTSTELIYSLLTELNFSVNFLLIRLLK